MLVGVLISIMISIVVGVNLVPSIVTSINTAKNTAGAPTGLDGLLDVLSYVYVAVILLGAVDPVAALKSNLHRITSQIRGNLRDIGGWYPKAIPSQAGGFVLRACVETRGFAPLGVMG